MLTECIKIVGLSKYFNEGEDRVVALNGVTLELEKGCFASVCGPSGSGKTTLLNLIGGLDRPSSGELYIYGERTDNLNPQARSELRLFKIGFIFQAYNLIPVLTALENVAFVMQLQGVERAEREERAAKLLSEVGMQGLEKRRPAELSGGQQQRVAVARAIVSNPHVVLADEPTANLDSQTARQLLELMQRMNQERNVSFIFSTHDSLVMSFAERMIRLHDGVLESDEIQHSR